MYSLPILPSEFRKSGGERGEQEGGKLKISRKGQNDRTLTPWLSIRWQPQAERRMERRRDDDRHCREPPEKNRQPGSPRPGDPRRKRSNSPRRRTKRKGGKKKRMRGRRCWNCRQRDHVFGGCPQPIEQKFCFRYGRQGRTVGECPRCGHGWRAQGPYIPGLGHVPREIRLVRVSAGVREPTSSGDSGSPC